MFAHSQQSQATSSLSSSSSPSLSYYSVSRSLWQARARLSPNQSPCWVQRLVGTASSPPPPDLSHESDSESSLRVRLGVEACGTAQITSVTRKDGWTRLADGPAAASAAPAVPYLLAVTACDPGNRLSPGPASSGPAPVPRLRTAAPLAMILKSIKTQAAGEQPDSPGTRACRGGRTAPAGGRGPPGPGSRPWASRVG